MEQLIRFFEEDQNIHQVILFGSYARGGQTAGRDMDIAIQLAEPMDAKQKLFYLEKYVNAQIVILISLIY